MQKLIKEVKSLTRSEYHRAMIKFGATNNSDHESFAIIEEEIEELVDEVDRIRGDATTFWNFCKSNAPDAGKLKILKSLHNDAIMAACEAIQVAAMAYKAEQTINCKGEQK